MLAEAQQFFAFLRETDVLELRKTRKEFIDALLEHMARSFFFLRQRCFARDYAREQSV